MSNPEKKWQTRWGSLILIGLFCLGLVCLFIPEVAVGGVTTAWIRGYHGGSGDYADAMALDSQGDIYVTGQSAGYGTDWDYLTIKYSPEGKKLWKRRYNGPGNKFDGARAIAIDDQDNVYVTGQSNEYESGYFFVTIKYSPDGRILWKRRYQGPPGYYHLVPTAMVLDCHGNVCITGYYIGPDFGGYTTIKYTPNGRLLWIRNFIGEYFDGFRGCEMALAIGVDDFGNVYVTGYSTGSETNTDFVTIKYNSRGQELWVRRYNGPGNGIDGANAMAIDGQGNVFVTGFSQSSETGNDYTTLKYDTNGLLLWESRYNGPGNGNDEATAIALDDQGNVYVTGSSKGADSGSDYTTIKYSPDGMELWVKRCNGKGNGNDYARAMAVDDHGNIYVTGVNQETSGSVINSNIVTIKYDTTGKRVWSRRCCRPGDPSAILLDSHDNVYVTGTSTGAETRWDYVTIKYIQTPMVGR